MVSPSPSPLGRWNAGAQRWEYVEDEGPVAADAVGDAPPPAHAAGEPDPDPAAGAAHYPDTDTRPGRPLTPPPIPWRLPGEDSVPDATRTSRARAHRLPLLVAGLVVAALVAAVVWWRAPAGDAPSGAGGATSATAFPTASPTSPAGYRIATGPGGVSLAVPQDWSYQLNGGTHAYVAPDYASYLEVGTVVGLAEHMEAARAFSRGVSSVVPGYTERAIGPVGEGPDAAVEVDFAYDATGGGRRRGIYRVFTAPDDTMYGVQVAGPGTDWPRQRQVMDTMLATFFAPGASF
ncbi:hypothetical protein AR457_30850 [Streptomyces agglomeratus]|uniref:hypothetical protein n=1 Tax=Streptomyces agglomeratus TaxID=285458 RepID=UPI00086C512D|nr:hypothetical protein [Streptomyces agglomeratus]OEJ47897.1 hypothetical protein AR457_30850 [Streptomyces agglomeratus]